MEALGVEMMPRRGFQALLGNKRALKELPVEQHHVWMIVWSVEGLTKQEGASEKVAPFGELTTTSATCQTGLGDGP